MLFNRSSLIAILTIISLVCSFSIQLVFVSKVETTILSDQIFLAMSFGMGIISIFSTSLGVFLIEALAKVSEERIRLSIKLVNHMMLKSVLYILPLAVIFHGIYFIFFFSQESKSELVNLNQLYIAISLQFIIPIFSYKSAIYASYYHSRSKYILVEFSVASASIISLIAIIFTNKGENIIILSFILVSKVFITYAILSIVFFKNLKGGNSQAVSFSYYKKLARRSRGVILSSVYYKSDIVIDRLLLSFLAGGVLTNFHLIQSLGNGAIAVYSRIVSIPLTSAVSHLPDNSTDDVKSILKIYMRKGLLLVLVGCLISLAILFTIIYLWPDKIFFLQTWDSQKIFFSLIITCGVMSINQIYSSFLFGLARSDLCVKIGVRAYTIGIILKIIMFILMGLNGFLVSLVLYQILVNQMYKSAINKLGYKL